MQTVYVKCWWPAGLIVMLYGSPGVDVHWTSFWLEGLLLAGVYDVFLLYVQNLYIIIGNRFSSNLNLMCAWWVVILHANTAFGNRAVMIICK